MTPTRRISPSQSPKLVGFGQSATETVARPATAAELPPKRAEPKLSALSKSASRPVFESDTMPPDSNIDKQVVQLNRSLWINMTTHCYPPRLRSRHKEDFQLNEMIDTDYDIKDTRYHRLKSEQTEFIRKAIRTHVNLAAVNHDMTMKPKH